MQSRLNHRVRRGSLLSFASTFAVAAALPALAADVTPQRLVNPEDGNWLHNHRTYDSQRYSPLEQINRGNVKGLKLAYAVAIGGQAPNENLQATPLAEDGYLYIVDQWGVLYKIDARDGQTARIIWRMDPGQEKAPLSNRGAALGGNLVFTTANYPSRAIATNKDTGKVVWETNLHDQTDVQLTAAPLVIKDKVIIPAAGGDRGVRDWLASLDAATGKVIWKKFTIPAPGEPGSETWKDKNNAWQIGGGAMWVTGSYDPPTNQLILGTGNPVPMFDPTYRPGDNLFTNSMISWNPDDGKMNWYHQYTPGDMWDYDEVGTHILFDAETNGQKRTLITHSARNGFLYTFERANGQTHMAKPYFQNITWTAGIDQKTGRPVDYNPALDIQVYSGKQNQTLTDREKKLCPAMSGGNNFWPTAYSQKTKMVYIPSLTACNEVKLDPSLSNKAGDWKGASFRNIERIETEIVVSDPLTGDVKKRVRFPYPNRAGMLMTGGGLAFTAFTDGTIIAMDDTTHETLWKINAGTGFMAPPMTFTVNGKQYVGILSGLSGISQRGHSHTPELKEQRSQTLLWVFSL